jgi:ubiquinone/menaquinone biosynthesis C-methylase UbiE
MRRVAAIDSAGKRGQHESSPKGFNASSTKVNDHEFLNKETFMSGYAETQQPSPELFFETLNAYQRTECLKGAIELGLFTAIAEGDNTAPALARHCVASERGIRILCDYLVVIGFLTKDENSYALTVDSAVFLNRHSPAYLGGTVKFLSSPEVADSFNDVAAIVRKGGTVLDEEGTTSTENPVWVEFARSMAPLMALPAELLAKLIRAGDGEKCKVLDIAAGHGLFGITIAKQNPNAEVAAVDWPLVLAVAEENAKAAGVAERYTTIPGSAFEVDYGGDYDVVLLTNFLHHFDPPTCESLLKKVYAALAPGGRAVTFEFVPNEDRVSPPVPATFSMMMLGTTPSGDAYTFSEFERMFGNAGFSSNELHPLPPTLEQVVISHK